MSFYKDIKKFGVNTVERYASGFPIDKDGNKKIVSLNGLWDFKFIPSVTEIPGSLQNRPSYSGFTKSRCLPIAASGSDTPIYTNVCNLTRLRA